MKSKKLILAPILAVLALVLLLLVQPTRAAGPLYVAPGGVDSGDCTNSASPCATIQYALAVATAGDEIRVATGTYTGTGNEVVLLSISATLSGGWNGAFTMQSGTSTIDGEGTRRGIYVISDINAVIEYFTVQNGTTPTTGSDGGGIYKAGFGGSLTLNNSTVSSNTSARWGGGIYGVGSVTLNNSTVSGNTAQNDGGGISYVGSLTLNNSTVSGNTTDDNGGGIDNQGGGPLTLNNSTISGNTSDNTGGGFRTFGTVTMQNTILAGNTASVSGQDCWGNLSSAGYNLIGDTSGCTFTPDMGDLTSLDPKLGPLQNNGGSTLTHALLDGSPAIDAGNPAGCVGSTGPLLTDQRGVPRLGRCDIGAYEVLAIKLSLTKAVDNPEPALGQQINYIITVNNSGTISATNALISDTLPVSITFAGPVTLDPNQSDAILATSALSLPTLASNVVISPQTSITLTLPVTVNLVLTETTTPIINTAAVTSAEISTPVMGSVRLGGNDIYLPILLKN